MGAFKTFEAMDFNNTASLSKTQKDNRLYAFREKIKPLNKI
jgi:hypothetical protein